MRRASRSALPERGRRALKLGIAGIVVFALVLAGLFAFGAGPFPRGDGESSFVDFDTSDASPAWSPRGVTIAFVSNRMGGGLFVVRPDGMGMRRISALPADNPDWSPDGKQIVFELRDGLYTIDANGGEARRVFRVRGASSLEPAWSPDGKWIAFAKELPDLSTAVYLVSPTGGPARRLAPPAIPRSDPGWSIGAASEAHPSWSPDGRRLAYQTTVNLTGEVDDFTEAIFVMNLDGTRRTRVTDGHKPAYEPRWSPDGKRIAFQCEGDVCVVDLADLGHHHRRLADGGGAPAWAPDSRRLVFQRYLYGGYSFFAHPASLSIVDAAGGAAHKLTFGPLHGKG